MSLFLPMVPIQCQKCIGAIGPLSERTKTNILRFGLLGCTRRGMLESDTDRILMGCISDLFHAYCYSHLKHDVILPAYSCMNICWIFFYSAVFMGY